MKFIAVLLCVCVFSFSSGCTDRHTLSDTPSDIAETSDTSPIVTDIKPLTLAYSGSDTLNPYTAETSVNLNLCSLLYEGLTCFDETLTPGLKLAASVEQTSDTALTVTLNQGVKFSDNTVVTPDDIIKSFSLAKSSDNFKALLSNVKSVKAKDDKSVVFELASPDINALACLSFPVIKPGKKQPPAGTGPYVFEEGENPCLKTNPHNAARPKIDKIMLFDSPDKDAMLYSLENGSVSYFYSDLSDGSIPRTSSASIKVPLNSLVFVGINSKRAALSDAHVRSALSIALNRNNICSSAFAGRARPAVAPFNPSWKAAQQINGFKTDENVSDAVAQLKQSGYNKLSLELLTVDENSFRLATAEMLVGQLARAGIELKVKKLPFSEYIKSVKAGNFELYLGEIRLAADMSLRPFFAKGGSASHGIKNGGDTSKAYFEYLSGQISIQDFTDFFISDVPFIPLCWRDGMAAYNRMLTGVKPIAFDIYNGIRDWNYTK